MLHGQVKSAGKFSFVRIFESGHEVPFYQPLVALEMVNRTIHGYDIATGQTPVTAGYVTSGPVNSDYVNGNATVTVEVLPSNATYNITTDEPNPPYNVANENSSDSSAPSRLMTRMGRADLDLEMKARHIERLPWHLGRRVVSKKGRHALFGDESRRKKRSYRR